MIKRLFFKSCLKSCIKSQKGLTLIEIMVTVFIISLMVGLVISRTGLQGEKEMQATADKMSGMMRYLFAKSASEGVYLKLVLDLGENTYWVESTRDPVFLTRQSQEKEKEEAPTAEGEQPKKATGFTKEEGSLLKTGKLPTDVMFKDVYAEHYDGSVSSGKAEIYFFPNGYVEHAIINLRNEDDDVHYSLETMPASGRVKIYSEYRSLEK